MNEEELLKQLQQYFFQNRSVDRQLPNGLSAYDPNQAKVWTDSYSLGDMFNNTGSYINQQLKDSPNNMWDHNDRTLRRLLEQRQRKIQM